MKMKMLMMSFWALTSTSSLYAQGQIRFANNAPVTIGSPSSVGPEAVGSPLGFDYTASLYYLSGSGYTQATFDSSNPILLADAQFDAFPGYPFDGLFSGGDVSLPFAGTVTVEVRAWFNGAATSYDDALSKGFNVGESVLLSGNAEAASPLSLGNLPSFTVQTAPEPTTFSLCSIGIVLLMIIRCRRYFKGRCT